jgi:hypothetical protein
MSNLIPDTDNIQVAVMTAALHLSDFPVSSSEAKTKEWLVDRLERFIDAYEVIWASVDQYPDDARAKLAKIKARD